MKKLLLAFMLGGGWVRADVPVPPAATQAQVNAGTATFPYVSPATLAGAIGLPSSVVTTSNTPTQMGIQPIRPYFGFVAAGNDNMPQGLYTGNKVENDWQPFIAESPMTNFQVYFANFYGNNETAPGGIATVSCAIHYSNWVAQAVFAGGQYTNIPNGQMAASLITSCPLIPQGAIAYVASYYTNGAGVILSASGTGPLEYSSFGATGSDKSTNSTIPGGVGTGNFSYGPIAILGNTTKASILILGDSRDWGVNDVNYFGSAGGAIPTFANGIARLFVPYYGYCNVSQPADRFLNYTGTTNRMFFTNFATVIWTDLGINEIITGAGSTMMQSATNFYALFSVPVCVETMSPLTTSSDGFFTVSNQTVGAADSYRTNFNYWARNYFLPYVSHVCDVAEITESSGLNYPCSGKWNVWASTNFPGGANACLTNMTVDGTHGDYFAVLAAGMGDPLRQQTPYVPTGLFPTVLTASGTFTGNGVGLTNIQPFLIQTNFILTKQYTNTYGCAITVSANVVTTTAAVVGESSIALMGVASPLVGGWTNTIGTQTTGSSLAISVTNVLSNFIQTNSPYWFTNTSSGAGDTVSIIGGQIKYP